MEENLSSLLPALVPNYSWGTPKIELSKFLYPNTTIRFCFPCLRTASTAIGYFFICQSLVLLSKILWERLNRLKYSLMSHPVAWGICFGNLQHH